MKTGRKELDTGQQALSPLGLALVALGAIALLSQMGIFRGLAGLVPALLFGGIGYYLLRRHYRSPGGEVSMLCLGFGLLGLAAASLLGPLSGPAFLALTAMGFLLAYSENRQRWWALIPGGVLLTLAVVAALGVFALPLSGGTIFFLGLAALFGYLYRHPSYPQPWAFYPAATMLALGVLTLVVGGGWLFPLALIVLGFYLLNRNRGSSVDWQEVVTSAAHTAESGFDAIERTLRRVLGSNVERAAREGAAAPGEAPRPAPAGDGTPSAAAQPPVAQPPVAEQPAAQPPVAQPPAARHPVAQPPVAPVVPAEPAAAGATESAPAPAAPQATGAGETGGAAAASKGPLVDAAGNPVTGLPGRADEAPPAEGANPGA